MLLREHLLDVDLRDVVQEQGRWLQFQERFLCLSSAVAARRVFLALGLMSVTDSVRGTGTVIVRHVESDAAVRFPLGHGGGRCF